MKLPACLLSILFATVSAAAEIHPPRNVEITYAATIANLPADAKTVDLWLPVASDAENQTVGKVTVVRPEGGEIAAEPKYGNRVYHRRFSAPFDPAGISAELSFELHRTEINIPAAKEMKVTPDTTAAPELAAYLQPNHLIPLDGPVRAIADKLNLSKLAPIPTARAVYDYLIDNMTYDWKAPGAGKGDTLRMCDSRTGDCTDYDSLFLALCRTRGIPADHAFGFPIRSNAESGRIPSYHCWARFYINGIGWIPIDASEADKHPELRDYNFGAQEPNLFLFSHGRDIELAPPQQGPPLNFFIYPYAEVDGKPHNDVAHVVSYKNLASAQTK